MLRLFLIFFCLTSIASAHVKPGRYQGVDQSGKACQFSVGKEWFVDDFKHPLNERIQVSGISFAGLPMNQFVWNVGHPPVVNVKEGKVRFNHDYFMQIAATSFGASSVILLKQKETSQQASEPVGIIYLEDHYNQPNNSKKWACNLIKR